MNHELRNSWALSGERALGALKKCVPDGGFPTDDAVITAFLNFEDGLPELEDISADDDDDGLPELEDISVAGDAPPEEIRGRGIHGFWPYPLLVGAVILPNVTFDGLNASQSSLLSRLRNVCPDDVKKAAAERRRLQENIALEEGLGEEYISDYGLGDMHDSFEMEEVD